MREVTAVQLRQSVRRVAVQLERDGEPVLLRLGQRPVGVIVSMRDFRERFALQVAAEERRRLVQELLARRLKNAPPASLVLDRLRGRSSRGH